MIAHISNDGKNRTESVAEHTKKTAFLCSKKGERCGLSQLMFLCGILHDMGKNKREFHDYLCADKTVRQKKRGSVSHASTGAKYLYDMHHNDTGSIKYMVELVSYAIAAHHGLFDCVDAEHTDRFSKKMDWADGYEESCRNARQDYLDAFKPEQIFMASADEFGLILNKLKTLLLELQSAFVSKKKPNPTKRLSDYKLFLLSCLQRLIVSILIDSDWEATSDFMEQVDTFIKQPKFDTKEIFKTAGEHFDVYMLEKRHFAENACFTEKEKRIWDARTLLQEECRRFAEHPAGIYCLPIPTGGGKTLASLAYALEYARRHRETERIFYVAPYISVTEQNAQVFCEAIGNESWILEHHSSVIRSREGKSGEERPDPFLKYDMNWEEPFICTTFVQFMNVLFSDKKEAIRRMHRLVHAVVIIDEVQSMPLKCIHTFNYMMNFLNVVCHTTIILCTATQPTLGEAECPVRYGEPKYMIAHAQEWFRKFERVRLYTPEKDKSFTFESLGDEIEKQMGEIQSILVVLNTKSAVRTLYDLLKARGITAEYLTTNLCAEHRSDKIKSIKAVLEKKRETIVVISTNLIEAGVDISFGRVYRSMTGLDSLAQTAGRCNRNGEMESGEVFLIRLEGENTGNRKELQQNIRVTEDVIFQYNNSEKQESLLMPKWMDLYYQEVYFYASDTMNFPIKNLDTSILELLSKGFGTKETKNRMNQAYQTAGQMYRLIDDDSFGVIVPYKKGAKIIEAIRTASDMAEFKGYIRQAQRYTVNVRASQLGKFEGLIQPVSDRIPDLYMVALTGAYHAEYGITPEWETLIF